jgi:Dna[CI] antecedent, DciA
MKKNNEQKMSEALKDFSTQKHIKEKLLSTKIENIWRSLYSDMIIKHTESFLIKKNALVIKISSAVLRKELAMNKKTILEQLNAKLDQDKIETLEFR